MGSLLAVDIEAVVASVLVQGLDLAVSRSQLMPYAFTRSQRTGLLGAGPVVAVQVLRVHEQRSQVEGSHRCRVPTHGHYCSNRAVPFTRSHASAFYRISTVTAFCWFPPSASIPYQPSCTGCYRSVQFTRCLGHLAT